MDVDFLCLYCRQHGHETRECPSSTSCSIRDPFADARMLDMLRHRPSSCCKRCEDYQLFKVAEEVDLVDQTANMAYIDGINHTSNVMTHWHREQQKHNLDLGPFHSVQLRSSCPLCRLIFRVFPMRDEDEVDDSASYYVRPFPSYDRQARFRQETTKDLKSQYCTYFCVESVEKAMGNLMTNFADTDSQTMKRVSEAFATSSETPAATRKALSARPRDTFARPAIWRRWLQRCSTTHGVSCRQTWSDELLITKMIDVSTRSIVPCVPNLEYVALSYVWGTVVPERDALKNDCLPQTIEDAITVTKELGLRYLWVDAVCIEQENTPEKFQQLSIMDVIYQCATVTIIALSGEDSSTGLPGVSANTPRVPQGFELIEGKKILTIFPMLTQDMEGTKYLTRAWTMQESMLTRCRLFFTNNQIHFWCPSAMFSESIDDELDPASYTEQLGPSDVVVGSNLLYQADRISPYTETERRARGEQEYRNYVFNYTGREMKNDSDSLNAFLGVAAVLRKSWFPRGLTWGMPLADFPQALRWYHPRWVKPRRRHAFPSWSWTGWEGQITYSAPLDLPGTTEQGRYESSIDMVANFVGVDGQVLILDAYIVRLDVRTDPFSDAFVPGTDVLLGHIKEGNFLHSNTLPSRTEDFLIVERNRYRVVPGRPFREDVYMLLIDWETGFAMRRTKHKPSEGYTIVNMAHPAIPDLVSFFYPIGNTPAVCLTRDIPREFPARILLLGCGDVRNVLYTCFVDCDISRPMDITCCDIQPAVIARNICLLSLVLDTSNTDQDQLVWDIYYHFYISKTALDLLVEQSKKLVALADSLKSWKAGKYGSLFRFCDSGTFLRVVDIWRGYTVTDKKARDLFSTKLRSDLKKIVDVKIKLFGTTGLVLSGFRSVSPIAVEALHELPKLHSDYQKYGTTTGTQAKEANPMFGSDGTLHYATHPLFGFHLAPAYAPLATTSLFRPSDHKVHKTVDVARQSFKAWSDAFKKCAENMVFRFYGGDALSFCQTLRQIGCAQVVHVQNSSTAQYYRQQNCCEPLVLDCEDYASGGDSPLLFTTIDTSNLVDHLGSMNVLAATSPLLEVKVYATLSTEVLDKQENSQLDIVNNLLCGDCPSMALLLGLIPIEYFTKATAFSSTEDTLINALADSDTGQTLVRINWKRTLSTTGAARTPLSFNPADLAYMLYKAYLSMFQHENLTLLLSGGMSRDDMKRRLQISQSQHYHRGSFANLLRVVKTSVAKDWGLVMDSLMGLLERDRTLMIGSSFLQELWVSLHDRDVYDAPNFFALGAASHGLLGSTEWNIAPPSACVTLQVPRSKIKIFTDRRASGLGIHILNCCLLSAYHTWQNNFAVLQFGFGKVTTSGKRNGPNYRVHIEEDPQGWEGSSPLLVSFLTPSWMLEQDKTTVSLFLQSSPASLAMFSSALGIQMNIFSTSIADKTNVFITSDRPNSSSALPSGSNSTLPPVVMPPNDKINAVVKMTAHVDRESDRIASLTGHADIISKVVKAALQGGGKVEIEQMSPMQATIVIAGKHRVQVCFPVPVVCSNAKTRIARKSSYVEIVAPVLKPTDHDSFSTFMHPMVLENGVPVSLNMSRMNLDGMAIVDVHQPSKLAWMHTHVSLMWSEREKSLRLASMNIPSAPDLRVNFKESLFSMFMHFTGAYDGSRHLPKGRMFAISDRKTGVIDIIILVSALRLDGANGTIALDAAAIPMTPGLTPEIASLLPSIQNSGIIKVMMDEDQVKLWKMLLPTYAERCRTWSHKKSCEYVRENSIPVTLEIGESSLCSCGSGIFPPAFMQDPKTNKDMAGWKAVAKHATRIAISPTFASPIVEELVGAKSRTGSAVNKQSSEKDSGFESPSTLFADKDKMRAFVEAMDKKKSEQGDLVNGEAIIMKEIDDLLKSQKDGRAAPHNRPETSMGKPVTEMEALEKAMAALIENDRSGCNRCEKEKQESGKALLTCARCLKAKYCSAECQKADWKAHKKVCRKD
ncbi:hypothetical protein E2P81_ATG06284 [Venturia nashicola]|nr:hypothetical protein E2P81_ATG06284 [Venturia nashicola]